MYVCVCVCVCVCVVVVVCGCMRARKAVQSVCLKYVISKSFLKKKRKKKKIFFLPYQPVPVTTL